MSLHALRPEFAPEFEHVRAAFERQRAAFRLAPAPTARERIATLRTLLELVRGKRNEFAKAICEDFGHRSLEETKLVEIMPASLGLQHAIRHVSGWMKGERRRVHPAFWLASARVDYQPLGVVGVIAPWNYPLLLALGPATCALAAGNNVLIKPSEHTPRLSEVLAAAIADAFGAHQLAVVTGGVDVAQAFSSLPFDHLLFTGSTEVGRIVAQAAARNLTPVTLELGGKSPAIIDEDFSIDRAIRPLLIGKVLNAGQTCVAPDYVFVHERKRDALVTAIRDAFASYYDKLSNPDYTGVASERHRVRLRGYLDDARAKGATVVEINPGDESAEALGPKMPLCLVLDPTDDMLVMKEEIFGPILPIKTFRHFDETIEYITERERPLALYVFSDDAGHTRRVRTHTHSGGLGINCTIIHVGIDDLPFGGVGASGMGAYHGQDGFRRFSHARAVCTLPRLNGTQLIAPPFGTTFRRIVDTLIG